MLGGVALDRQSIERRDFPIARRGYDIEAVDAHLRMVADEHDALTRGGRGAGAGSIAAAAADQVRQIVEAAEQTASEMTREAELEARQVRQDAREDAERLRAEAAREARQHVGRVAELARGMLERIQGMDGEVAGLVQGLRAGSQRLSADLSLLQSSIGDAAGLTDHRAADGGREDAVAGNPPALASDDDVSRSGSEMDAGLHPAGPGADQPAGSAEQPDGRADQPAASADQPDGGADQPAAGADQAVADAAEMDAEAAPVGDGARMVALNMALNGVAREETERHIERNFDVPDLPGLIDDVYARVGRR